VELIVRGTEPGPNCKHRAPMAGRTGLEPGLHVSNPLISIDLDVHRACVQCVCGDFAIPHRSRSDP